MNIGSIKDELLAIYNIYNREKNYRIWKKNVKIKKLTKEQKKEIKCYYKDNFGISVTTKFHELLYSICGVFRKEYMPLEVISDVENILSPFKYAKVMDDKAMYDWTFPGIQFPERVAICCNGVTYRVSSEGDLIEIGQKELLNIVSDLQECIIKPSRDSSGGIGVQLFQSKKGVVTETGRTVKELLNSYHGNYVIEKKVVNNENLRVLNPTSCNTLRIITWRNREKECIELVSALLRIGGPGAIIDNTAAGGIAVPVGKDGKLSNSGCIKHEYRRVEKTLSGVELKGYTIEHYSELVETAKKAHKYLPYFDFVGWDMTVNEHGEVIVIEFNPQPDIRLGQMTFLDSYLLDKQKEILTFVYKAKGKIH